MQQNVKNSNIGLNAESLFHKVAFKKKENRQQNKKK